MGRERRDRDHRSGTVQRATPAARGADRRRPAPDRGPAPGRARAPGRGQGPGRLRRGGPDRLGQPPHRRLPDPPGTRGRAGLGDGPGRGARRRQRRGLHLPHGHGQRLAPAPAGRFDLYLNDRRMLAFTLTKDSQRWLGEGCSLYFDVRLIRATAFGASLTHDEKLREEAVFVDGMALLRVAPELLPPGRPARLRVVPVQRRPSRRWFRLGRPLHPFLTDHLEPGLSVLLTPKRPPRVGEHQLLVGDLHAHSAESLARNGDGCGEGGRSELFIFARDVAGLDLFCLSEHDWQMNDRDWKELTATSDRFDEPGRFVTVPGYEWTSPSYGHRNVYFRDAGAAMFPSVGPGVPVNRILDEARGPPTCGGTWTPRGWRPSPCPTTCRWRCSRCPWSSSTTPATTGRPRSTPAGATPWSTTGRCRPTP